MQSSDIIKHFSFNIFWDTDLNTLDLDLNKRFIIQRVLELGTRSDWELIKEIYGLSGIMEEMKKAKNLDNTALSFISSITNTTKEEYRCYTLKQSHQKHWSF